MSTSDAIGRARRGAKRRKRTAGVAFLVTGTLLIWLSVALYNKQFSSVALVTVYTSSVGNEMHPGNQVMVRGVQVGEVRQVSASGSGARLLLAMNPSQLHSLPANVSAEMLPTTLFGERYVDLVLPTQPATATLTDGSVIRQNRSADALELEQVLNNLLPMLQAVQPDKLSLTLTAIAQGLQGRGTELGQTLVTLNAWLTEINPQLPQFDTDIRRLAGLTKTYNEATPALLAALDNFSVNGQTLASHRFNYMALLANVKAASDDFRSFLDANGNNSVNLSNDSVPSLGILARYAPEFPCTLANLAEFVPEIDKVLGAGSNQPGLHVRVIVVPSLGPYKAGKDTPSYGDDLGPHCYEVPFKGISLNDGVHQPGKKVRP
jgi:phospholipid/cholesterol/gamma-HCH transport system substrate-binding protein